MKTNNFFENELVQSLLVIFSTIFVFFLVSIYSGQELGNFVVLGIMLGLFNSLLFHLSLAGFLLSIVSTIITTTISYLLFPENNLSVFMTATSMTVGLITLIIHFAKHLSSGKQAID